jgi:hypothetical protein
LRRLAPFPKETGLLMIKDERTHSPESCGIMAFRDAYNPGISVVSLGEQLRDMRIGSRRCELTQQARL